MDLALFTGRANPGLGRATAEQLHLPLGNLAIESFPDGEIHVEVMESVRGSDVYLIQPTTAPSSEHLFELLMAADACRRAGAQRLTAVVPYLAYARQDRRANAREAVAARLVARVLEQAGFDRIVAIDLHSTALEGFFDVPLEHLSAVPLLADAVRAHVSPNSAILAPDLGASKLAGRYARLLGLPVAIVHKTRLSGSEVSATAISGDVSGHSLVVIDDMISTAGTVRAATLAALDQGATPDVVIVATHGLLAETAAHRLQELPLRRLFCTDTAAFPGGLDLPIQIVSVAGLLAEAIHRLHAGESLADLIRHD